MKHPGKGRFTEERKFYSKYLSEFNEDTIIGVPTYQIYSPYEKHGKAHQTFEDVKRYGGYFAKKALGHLKFFICAIIG